MNGKEVKTDSRESAFGQHAGHASQVEPQDNLAGVRRPACMLPVLRASPKFGGFSDLSSRRGDRSDDATAAERGRGAGASAPASLVEAKVDRPTQNR